MKPKTIVFWGREDIFSYSVKHLLATEKEWNVLSLSPEESLDSMLQVVDKATPDVVVIHQENYGSEPNMPTMLLQNHPDLKVIAFTAEDTTMEVYSKQKVLVKSASDFLSVVKADLITIKEDERQNEQIFERR